MGSLPSFSIKSGSADSGGVTRVFSTGGDELATKLGTAAHGSEAEQTLTAGLQDRSRSEGFWDPPQPSRVCLC